MHARTAPTLRWRSAKARAAIHSLHHLHALHPTEPAATKPPAHWAPARMPEPERTRPTVQLPISLPLPAEWLRTALAVPRMHARTAPTLRWRSAKARAAIHSLHHLHALHPTEPAATKPPAHWAPARMPEPERTRPTVQLPISLPLPAEWLRTCCGTCCTRGIALRPADVLAQEVGEAGEGADHLLLGG